jgi:endoglucanase
MAALDVAAEKGVDHLAVLLTRAEEVGFIGAIAACKLGTIPLEARVLSIECSRSSAEAPLGKGPVVRVGDASSVFNAELTNAISAIVRETGLVHQRKLMAGGSCEATAFHAYGYEASGLCLPLDNYHNMVDIDGVLDGRRRARLGPERIALADFHGLIELLVVTAERLGQQSNPIRGRLERVFASERQVLTETVDA